MANAACELIAIENSRFPLMEVGGFPESVQFTVKVVPAPGVNGAPEIIPVPALRFKPAGSAPEETDQVKGGVPPCTKFMRLREIGRPGSGGCGWKGSGINHERTGITVASTELDCVGALADVAVTL